MQFSPQGGDSYRLGDFARSTQPDGDYVGIITTFEAAQGKDNQPQIKVTADLRGPQTGKKHTWWYTCTKAACFRLFDDLIRLGVDPNFDAGPPLDGNGQNRWAAMFAPGLQGKAVQINIASKGDFTNTSLMGFATLGPDGQPVGNGVVTGAPATASSPFAAAMPSVAQPAPTPAGAPTATVDVGSATDLFRRS